MRRNCWSISRTGRCDGISRALPKIFLCLLLLAGGAFVVRGDDSGKLNASLDTNKIRIGEQIKLTLQIDAQKSDKVELPVEKELSQTFNDKLELVGARGWDTIRKDDLERYINELLVTGFDSGAYMIKPVGVKINDAEYFTQPFMIEVTSVEVDTLKQPRYGIKDIREVPYTFGELAGKYWWTLAALLALCGLVWLGLWYFRRPKKEKLSPEMLLSPYERALFRLQRLDAEKLWQNGQVKEYYIGLTDVIRHYLDDQWGTNAMEQTSDEILQSVRTLPFPERVLDELKKLLKDSDLVKFAKMLPTESENEYYRRVAEKLIEETKPENPQPEDHGTNEL